MIVFCDSVTRPSELLVAVCSPIDATTLNQFAFTLYTLDGERVQAKQKDYCVASGASVDLPKLRRIALMNGIVLEIDRDMESVAEGFLATLYPFAVRNQTVEFQVFNDRLLGQESVLRAIASMRKFENELLSASENATPIFTSARSSRNTLSLTEEFVLFLEKSFFTEGDKFPIFLGDCVAVASLLRRQNGNWITQIHWMDGPEKLESGDLISAWSIEQNKRVLGAVVSVF